MDPSESIRLDHFLKAAGVAQTGGHAKIMIQNGDVMLNGEVETRRRKKLVIGDQIEVEGTTYIVSAEEEETAEESPE